MADRFEFLTEHTQSLEDILNEEISVDEKEIDIRNQVLSDALKSQIELQMKYEEIYRTACWITNELEDEAERMFSIAFTGLLNDSYKSLNVTEAKQYAASDSDYVDTKRLLNKAKLVKGRSEGILEAIKTRRFILKNICDVLQAGNEGHII